MRMPFGKFKGISISDLDDDYLSWLRSLGDLREPLRSSVEAEWNFRQAPHVAARLSSDEKRMAEELVAAGYRALARVHHPDKGGDTRAMQLVNAAVEALRRWVRSA